MADDPRKQPEQRDPGGLRGVGVTVNEATPIAEDLPELPVSNVKELFTDNLFKDAKNTILTLVFGGLLVYALYRAFTFVFLNTKVIEGVERSGWEVVADRLQIYMLGPNFLGTGVTLPSVWIGIAVLLAAAGLAFGLLSDPDAPPMRTRTRVAMIGAPGLGIVLGAPPQRDVDLTGAGAVKKRRDSDDEVPSKSSGKRTKDHSSGKQSPGTGPDEPGGCRRPAKKQRREKGGGQRRWGETAGLE